MWLPYSASCQMATNHRDAGNPLLTGAYLPPLPSSPSPLQPVYNAVRGCVAHYSRPAAREWAARYLPRCISIVLSQGASGVGRTYVGFTNGILAGAVELACLCAAEGHWEALKPAAKVLLSGVEGGDDDGDDKEGGGAKAAALSKCSTYWGWSHPGEETLAPPPGSEGIPSDRRAVYLHCVRRATLELLPRLVDMQEAQMAPAPGAQPDASPSAVSAAISALVEGADGSSLSQRATQLASLLVSGAPSDDDGLFTAPLRASRAIVTTTTSGSATTGAAPGVRPQSAPAGAPSTASSAPAAWPGCGTAEALVTGSCAIIAALAHVAACGGDFAGTGKTPVLLSYCPGHVTVPTATEPSGAGRSQADDALAIVPVAQPGSADDDARLSVISGPGDGEDWEDMAQALALSVAASQAPPPPPPLVAPDAIDVPILVAIDHSASAAGGANDFCLGPGLGTSDALSRVLTPALSSLAGYCDGLASLPDDLLKRETSANDALRAVMVRVEGLWEMLAACSARWDALPGVLREALAGSSGAALPEAVPIALEAASLDALVAAYPHRLRFMITGAALRSSGLTRKLWALEQVTAHGRALQRKHTARAAEAESARKEAIRTLLECDDEDALRDRSGLGVGRQPLRPTAINVPTPILFPSAAKTWAGFNGKQPTASTAALSADEHAKALADARAATDTRRAEAMRVISAEGRAQGGDAVAAPFSGPSPRTLASWLLHPSVGFLDTLTGSGSAPHEEYCRRACDPLGLVAAHGLLRLHHVDRLWAATLGAHASSADAQRGLLIAVVESGAPSSPALVRRLLGLLLSSAGCEPHVVDAVLGNDAGAAPFDACVGPSSPASHSQAVGMMARACQWYLDKKGVKATGPAALGVPSAPATPSAASASVSFGKTSASGGGKNNKWVGKRATARAAEAAAFGDAVSAAAGAPAPASPTAVRVVRPSPFSQGGEYHTAEPSSAAPALSPASLTAQGLDASSQLKAVFVSALLSLLLAPPIVAPRESVAPVSIGATGASPNPTTPLEQLERESAQMSALLDAARPQSSSTSSYSASAPSFDPLDPLPGGSDAATLAAALFASLGDASEPQATSALVARVVAGIRASCTDLQAQAPDSAAPIARTSLHDPVPLLLELLKRLLRHAYASGVGAAPHSEAAVGAASTAGIPGALSLRAVLRGYDAQLGLCDAVYEEACRYAVGSARVPPSDGHPFTPPAALFSAPAFAKRLQVLYTLLRYRGDPAPAAARAPALAPFRLTPALCLRLWDAVNQRTPAALESISDSVSPPSLSPLHHSAREVYWEWLRRVTGGGRWDVRQRGADGASSAGGGASAGVSLPPGTTLESLTDAAASSLRAGDRNSTIQLLAQASRNAAKDTGLFAGSTINDTWRKPLSRLDCTLPTARARSGSLVDAELDAAAMGLAADGYAPLAGSTSGPASPRSHLGDASSAAAAGGDFSGTSSGSGGPPLALPVTVDLSKFGWIADPEDLWVPGLPAWRPNIVAGAASSLAAQHASPTRPAAGPVLSPLGDDGSSGSGSGDAGVVDLTRGLENMTLSSSSSAAAQYDDTGAAAAGEYDDADDGAGGWLAAHAAIEELERDEREREALEGDAEAEWKYSDEEDNYGTGGGALESGGEEEERSLTRGKKFDLFDSAAAEAESRWPMVTGGPDDLLGDSALAARAGGLRVRDARSAHAYRRRRGGAVAYHVDGRGRRVGATYQGEAGVTLSAPALQVGAGRRHHDNDAAAAGASGWDSGGPLPQRTAASKRRQKAALTSVPRIAPSAVSGTAAASAASAEGAAQVAASAAVPLLSAADVRLNTPVHVALPLLTESQLDALWSALFEADRGSLPDSVTPGAALPRAAANGLTAGLRPSDHPSLLGPAGFACLLFLWMHACRPDGPASAALLASGCSTAVITETKVMVPEAAEGGAAGAESSASPAARPSTKSTTPGAANATGVAATLQRLTSSTGLKRSDSTGTATSTTAGAGDNSGSALELAPAPSVRVQVRVVLRGPCDAPMGIPGSDLLLSLALHAPEPIAQAAQSLLVTAHAHIHYHSLARTAVALAMRHVAHAAGLAPPVEEEATGGDTSADDEDGAEPEAGAARVDPGVRSLHQSLLRAVPSLHDHPLVTALLSRLSSLLQADAGPHAPAPAADTDSVLTASRCLALLRAYSETLPRSVSWCASLCAATLSQRVAGGGSKGEAAAQLLECLPRRGRSKLTINAALEHFVPRGLQSHKATCGDLSGAAAAAAGEGGVDAATPAGAAAEEAGAPSGGQFALNPAAAVAAPHPDEEGEGAGVADDEETGGSPETDAEGAAAVPSAAAGASVAASSDSALAAALSRHASLVSALASSRVCGAPPSSAHLHPIHNKPRLRDAVAEAARSTLRACLLATGNDDMVIGEDSESDTDSESSGTISSASTADGRAASSGAGRGTPPVRVQHQSRFLAQLVSAASDLGCLLMARAALVPLSAAGPRSSPSASSSLYLALLPCESDYDLLFRLLDSPLAAAHPSLRAAAWATLMALPTSPALVRALGDPASVDWDTVLAPSSSAVAPASGAATAASSAAAGSSSGGGLKALYCLQAVAARLRSGGSGTERDVTAQADADAWREGFTSAGGSRAVVRQLLLAHDSAGARDGTGRGGNAGLITATALRILQQCVSESQFFGADPSAALGLSWGEDDLLPLLRCLLAVFCSPPSAAMRGSTGSAPAGKGSAKTTPRSAEAEGAGTPAGSPKHGAATAAKSQQQRSEASQSAQDLLDALLWAPAETHSQAEEAKQPQLRPVALALVRDPASIPVLCAALSHGDEHASKWVASTLLVSLLGNDALGPDAAASIAQIVRNVLASAPPTLATAAHIGELLTCLTRKQDSQDSNDDADAPAVGKHHSGIDRLLPWVTLTLGLISRWWEEGCARAHALQAASIATHASASLSESLGLPPEMRRLLYIASAEAVAASHDPSTAAGASLPSSLPSWSPTEPKPLLDKLLRILASWLRRIAPCSSQVAVADPAAGTEEEGLPSALQHTVQMRLPPPLSPLATAEQAGTHRLLDACFNLIAGACLYGPRVAMPTLAVTSDPSAPSSPPLPAVSPVSSGPTHLCHTNDERIAAFLVMRVVFRACALQAPEPLAQPVCKLGHSRERISHRIASYGLSGPQLAILGRIEAVALGPPPVRALAGTAQAPRPSSPVSFPGEYPRSHAGISSLGDVASTALSEPALDSEPIVDASEWAFVPPSAATAASAAAATAVPAATASTASAVRRGSSTGGPTVASGFTGLVNAGCTCYVNALLQQLFMTPEIRRAILHADLPLPHELAAEAAVGGAPAVAAPAGDVIAGTAPPAKTEPLPPTPPEALQRARLLLELQRAFLWLRGGSLAAYDPRPLVEACACLGLPNSIWAQVRKRPVT